MGSHCAARESVGLGCFTFMQMYLYTEWYMDKEIYRPIRDRDMN